MCPAASHCPWSKTVINHFVSSLPLLPATCTLLLSRSVVCTCSFIRFRLKSDSLHSFTSDSQPAIPFISYARCIFVNVLHLSPWRATGSQMPGLKASRSLYSNLHKHNLLLVSANAHIRRRLTAVGMISAPKLPLLRLLHSIVRPPRSQVVLLYSMSPLYSYNYSRNTRIHRNPSYLRRPHLLTNREQMRDYCRVFNNSS